MAYLKSFRIPLHLGKTAETTAGLLTRIDLTQNMMALRPNGDGFRKVPTSKKGAKSLAKQKSPLPTTRLEAMCLRAFGAGA